MNEEQAFLQAIVDNPDDDAPRLIFADWLEERGDKDSRARAEFIRVQFALRDLPPEHPLRPQLEERERDLLLAYEKSWLAPLQSQCRVDRCSFGRGFVEGVRLRLDHLAEDGDKLFALTPIQDICVYFYGSESEYEKNLKTITASPYLRRVRGLHFAYLSGFGLRGPSLQGLLSSAHLSTLRVFSFSRYASPDVVPHFLDTASFLPGLRELRLDGPAVDTHGLQQLLGSSRLASLTTLDIKSYSPNPVEMEAIANSPFLDRLETLHWTENGGGLSSISILAKATGLPNLRKLYLRDNRLQKTDIRSFARSDLLGRLETLDLSTNRLGADGVADLAKSPRANRLRRLDLSTNSLGVADVSTLARSQHLERLGSLFLRNNRLLDAGARALSNAPGLAGLTCLQLSYNGIGVEGVKALAGAPPGQLEILDLSWNPLTGEGVRALARSRALANLVALNLSYCQVDDDALHALAESPYLNHLHTLNLGTNRITDAGVTALAHSTGLPQLTALNLGNNAIGDTGVRALADSPRFRRLTALNLAGNRIDVARLDELRRDFRGCLGG